MRKKFIIYVGAIIIGLCSIQTSANAISVHLPGRDVSTTDYNKENDQQSDGNISYLSVISLVNEYLRFTVGLVCFLFMIINGYKLIMARGEGKQMKSAVNALIGCGVGIAVCLLAYIIVDIAVSLL